MFKIKWENEIVAEAVCGEGLLPIFKVLPNVERYKLPISLFGFDKNECSWDTFMEWCNGRVIPKDRVDLDVLLAKMGLNQYDVIEIIKVTGGISSSDSFSIEAN